MMRIKIGGISICTSPRRGFWILLIGFLCTTSFMLLTGTGTHYNNTHLSKFYDNLQENRYYQVKSSTAHPTFKDETSTKATVDQHSTVNSTMVSTRNQFSPSDNVTSRHLLLRDLCKQFKLNNFTMMKYAQPFPNRAAIASIPAIISRKLNFLYCPLTKAGSTFFKRYIVAMEKGGSNISPFDIKIENSRGPFLSNLKSIKNINSRAEFEKKSYKFVFTRDPYWRLFSTYIDKLYSPNSYYWGDWGQKAILTFGLNEEEHPCGSRISFQDLIRTVIFSLHKRDEHFIPMTRHCRLCDVEYDMVGKAEHAIPEIDYLANKLNVSSSFQHQENYRKATAFDVIDDSTKDVYQSWLRHVKNCIGGYEMNRIIWRRLQIRGIIDADIHFPLSEGDATSITRDEFRALCRQAAEKSTDTAKLKKQKIEAFVEAYKSVRPEQLKRVQEIYRFDFQLLGYDIAPDLIYQADRSTVNTNILDYMKEWR